MPTVNSSSQSTPPLTALQLVNISLALAFTLSTLLSPGGRLLRLWVGLPLLQSIPPYQTHFLNAFANYWLAAILIYLALRLTRLGSWLKPTPAIHVMIGIGNALLILYVAARVFASTVEGGGASYAVAAYSLIIVVPSLLLFLGGFSRLLVRSIRLRKEPSEWRPFRPGEGAGVFIALAVPTIFASTLFVGEDAPFRLAREAAELFEKKCVLAGERLISSPIEEVKGLYLDLDGGVHYSRMENGVYSAHSEGILGQPLISRGWLEFYETKPLPRDESSQKYRRHTPQDYPKNWKGQPTDELQSKYGLFTVKLENESEKKLGVRGEEIKIVDLGTKEIIASTIYFIETRHRRFCGHAPNNDFSVSDFIHRALNLKSKTTPPSQS